MLEILKGMMKEEWRIHSCLFGNFMFALFPVILLILSFSMSLFIPILTIMLPIRQITIVTHYIFVLFGLSVGSFGLFGREAMNRRFGQASLMAYSSRSLPVSERELFVNFFIKDIIYYFILWILPFVLGFSLASPLISVSLSSAPLILLTLTLSFLTGLSFVFCLSTIYVHSSKVLLVVLISILTIGLFLSNYFYISLTTILPSLSFFLAPSFTKLIISLSVIIVLFILSSIFLKVDYPQKVRRLNNSFDKLSNFFKFTKYPDFISKDFLDLKRSEGGLGKIIFSFLFPLFLAWILIFVFLKFLPIFNFLIIFSLFLGIISSSFYNWITEFDVFTSYAFLPVKVSNMMKSKIICYAIINIIPVIILILVAIVMNQLFYFLPALFLFLSISSYTMAVLVYLGGLFPNILIYNAKIFLEYLLLTASVIIVLVFLSAFNPFYSLVSPVMIIASFYLIKKSFKKWNKIEQPTF